MQELQIHSGQGDYLVHFPDSFQSLLEELQRIANAVIVIDRKVASLHRETLAPLLSSHRVLELDATEDNKTLDGVSKTCTFLQECNCTKSSRMIAIGGGIIQDIAILSAHLYYRGIPCTFVPTTLLAMADSCIGAKCGVNLNSFKNQLGCFQSPASVHICDPFLATLADQEIASGYGEILKLMFTGSPAHFAKLRSVVESSGLRNVRLPELIRDSLEVKKGVIEVDEYEHDLRRILNYGHTFGHALESVTHHAVPHGLAVIWGMDLVNFIAVERKLVAPEVREQMRTFARAAMPWKMTAPLTPADLINAARRDKKAAMGKINLAIPRDIGQLVIVPVPFDGELERQIDQYIRHENIFA